MRGIIDFWGIFKIFLVLLAFQLGFSMIGINFYVIASTYISNTFIAMISGFLNMIGGLAALIPSSIFDFIRGLIA